MKFQKIQQSSNKAFAKVLIEYRQNSKITQYLLSKKTGVPRQYISLLEKGVRCPTILTVFKLADGLNITPQELLSQWLFNETGALKNHQSFQEGEQLCFDDF